MKIDAHQHFWIYDEKEYSWIGDNMLRIKRSFLPDDLAPLLTENGFDGCVAVQARQSLEETRFLLELADKHDFIKGVVGWVDLRSDNVKQQLDVFSKNPKFKGVRHVLQDEQDDQFMLGESFQKGISLLAQHHLTYDILVFPKHLPYVKTFVESFPDQPFVIDHLAKPDIKNQVHEPWASDIKSIAQFPNVLCKLSGMITEAAWNTWKPSDFNFYLNTIFDAFGEDRIMIGSDWPVCLLAAEDYQSVMGIVTQFLNAKSESARSKILGGNAVRFYSLH